MPLISVLEKQRQTDLSSSLSGLHTHTPKKQALSHRHTKKEIKYRFVGADGMPTCWSGKPQYSDNIASVL